MREVLISANLPAPRFRYSPCVKAGPNYQFAGMIALDTESGVLESGGPGAEAAKILDNLRRAMGDFGLSYDNLIAATIYTTEMARFDEINRAWEAVFTDEVTPPARTAIGVVALPLGASVEIEFRFYKED